MKLARLLACLPLLAALPAAAQSPASVKQLLAQGYHVVGVSPITGSYAMFLSKGDDVIVCQIGFDAAKNAFATEKCYPLAN